MTEHDEIDMEEMEPALPSHAAIVAHRERVSQRTLASRKHLHMSVYVLVGNNRYQRAEITGVMGLAETMIFVTPDSQGEIWPGC